MYQSKLTYHLYIIKMKNICYGKAWFYTAQIKYYCIHLSFYYCYRHLKLIKNCAFISRFWQYEIEREFISNCTSLCTILCRNVITNESAIFEKIWLQSISSFCTMWQCTLALTLVNCCIIYVHCLHKMCCLKSQY